MGSETLILGGGLAGLAAGWALTQAGRRVQVLEGGSTVGGLARTIVRDGFRFDLGGHRFLTSDARVERLVRDLLGAELVTVPRASRIYLRGEWVEYPLKPRSALFGLGLRASAAILLGYAAAMVERRLRPAPLVSLEDWVAANFGRPLFDLYFREYSEKLWGVSCRDISAEWMAQRVQGLSLGAAIRRALLKRGSALPTLADQFSYPRLGLRYRDLVIVTVMLDRARATDQTWIYFPGKDIPFGRLHEPTNWSAAMAPPGHTLLVTERFCFRGDATWNATDAELIATTVLHLE